jgi:methylated-DNA-[protein]-cysteine S-methyltransferase
MNFNEQVWAICRKVPKGRVTTYKAIAQTLGTKAYRAVGNAMHNNPYAPEVPCHRVVKSNGELGGFARGKLAKKKLLEKEGIRLKDGKIADFQKVLQLSL